MYIAHLLCMKENTENNTDSKAFRVAHLIAGYIGRTLSAAERQELNNWINTSDSNKQLFESLTDEQAIASNMEWMDAANTSQTFQQLKEAGRFNPVRKIQLQRWLYAAASVIVLLGLSYLLIRNFTNTNADVNKKTEVVQQEPLQPGANKATLTLADGRLIDLNEASNGWLFSKEGKDVSNPIDGELVYGQSGSTDVHAGMRTLSVPMGGQFQLRLPDGTKVWLNAATTFRYPNTFTGAERQVEMTGEAYFEVAKNTKQPFIVRLADSNAVTVLGTHFNVQAYPEDQGKKITLLQGKVRVQNKNNEYVITPGTQATVTASQITTAQQINMKEVIGWKDGLFVFRNASIETIMQQVAKWYDAKIIYQGKIDQRFNATILRSEPLEKLLHLLETNGHIKFKTENNTIYVLP